MNIKKTLTVTAATIVLSGATLGGVALASNPDAPEPESAVENSVTDTDNVQEEVGDQTGPEDADATPDAVLHPVARRKHQDRRPPSPRAEFPADREAVAAGKHYVEHDRVVVVVHPATSTRMHGSFPSVSLPLQHEGWMRGLGGPGRRAIRVCEFQPALGLSQPSVSYPCHVGAGPKSKQERGGHDSAG